MNHKERNATISVLDRKGVRVYPSYNGMDRLWKMIVEKDGEVVKIGKVSLKKGSILTVGDCNDTWDKTLQWAHKKYKDVREQTEALQGDQ